MSSTVRIRFWVFVSSGVSYTLIEAPDHCHVLVIGLAGYAMALWLFIEGMRAVIIMGRRNGLW